jgi:hypothetical protein
MPPENEFPKRIGATTPKIKPNDESILQLGVLLLKAWPKIELKKLTAEPGS